MDAAADPGCGKRGFIIGDGSLGVVKVRKGFPGVVAGRVAGPMYLIELSLSHRFMTHNGLDLELGLVVNDNWRGRRGLSDL